MSKSTTSKQENSPPAWSKPLFEQSASEAGRLYNSGAGGNTYLGSTVAGPSDTTMSGINQLSQAGQAWDTSGTRDLFAGIGASAAGPSAADTYLTDTASGKYLQEGNPYYRQRLDKEIADSNAMIQSSFSGAGRYGSGVNQQTIADNTSGMLLQGLESDWNRERQNQLAAVGMLDNARFTGLGQAQGAASSMAGLDQQNFQNRLAGAGATMQAGQALDDQSQAMLNDEIAKFYALDNEEWNRLGMLQAAAAGSAGNYGTSTMTQRQPISMAPLAALFGGK